MLRTLFALFVLASATLSSAAHLEGAEKAEAKFHYSLFRDSPPIFNANDAVVAHSYVDGKYVGPRAPLEKYLELTKKK